MDHGPNRWPVQRAIDGVGALPLSPTKGSSKTHFSVFLIKFNFKRIQSATKFRCVKTSMGKVVEQSINYEITAKHTTKSVSFLSFLLKYWLKLTYPVVTSTCMLAGRTLSRPWSRKRTALLNDVMSKTESGQLHSELLGRRHTAVARSLCDS